MALTTAKTPFGKLSQLGSNHISAISSTRLGGAEQKNLKAISAKRILPSFKQSSNQLATCPSGT